jgi:hypothetical protein
MEKNGGITKGKGKKKYFLLFDCIDEKNGCRGCPEREHCDGCGIKVCIYLAKYIDGELLCPECWESGGCLKDERTK